MPDCTVSCATVPAVVPVNESSRLAASNPELVEANRKAQAMGSQRSGIRRQIFPMKAKPTSLLAGGPTGRRKSNV